MDLLTSSKVRLLFRSWFTTYPSLKDRFTPETTKPYSMSCFDILNRLLGFICVQNVLLEIFIFRILAVFTVFHNLPEFLLFSSSQYHLPRGSTSQFTPCAATLDTTINKHTHGGCDLCVKPWCWFGLQSIHFKTFGGNMITSLLTTKE